MLSAMTKVRSSQLDGDDIVTPSDQSSAADRSGPGLRMPPIIDISPSFGRRLIERAKSLLRGTLYQTSLIGLLLMALGLMVLTLMQAGNIETPDWRQLAVSLEDLRNENSPAVRASAPPEEPFRKLSPEAQPTLEAPQQTAMTGETEVPLPAQIEPVTPMLAAPEALALELEAEIIDLRQTLADTRRDLAAAQAALLEQQASTSGDELAQLTKRATLSELLLRLDDGVAFDDLLDGGKLDNVLHKNELAALALHAARGVPTEASIRAQAETLPLIIGGKDGTNNQLPEVISWLAAKAPKLISVRQSPMAGAQKDLRVLYDQLQARDYRAAAATTRLLILANDEAVSMQSEATLALQALYADLRAFSETRAARTDLRRDYMAGVRP